MSGGDSYGALGSPWDALNRRVGDRLVRVESPLAPHRLDPASPSAAAVLDNLRSPFFIESEPGAFQTTGWLDAFTAEPSLYAVAASGPEDIAAAVAFARDRDVRLVIKGTGHDYLGRSSAPDSLLVWTHHMREITVHDAFQPTGGPTDQLGVPAITVGAGTRWLEVYQAAARHGRYAQGGGCTSVGAAGGFTQGGGFGSFSRRFGTAAGNVLEIEVVTASGEIVIANGAQHQDLFWALRGGGGGTFGVVSKMTLQTHDMPTSLGAAIGTITAATDADYRRLVRELVAFYPQLANEHWGEQIRLAPDNSLQVAMLALELTEDQMRTAWQPFVDWIDQHRDAVSSDLGFAVGPFETFWDRGWWNENFPDMICTDDRAGQPPGLFWWSANQNEVSQYLNSYQSRWLPIGSFQQSPDTLADALYSASRLHYYSLHANKGLTGANSEALARDAQTSINPATFDAIALLIMASNQQHAYPGVPGHEPDLELGATESQRIDVAMNAIRRATPDAGAYVNEADYFEPDWQQSFWGSNYRRLLDIKRRYDPTNLFRVHHGVGSGA